MNMCTKTSLILFFNSLKTQLGGIEYIQTNTVHF